MGVNVTSSTNKPIKSIMPKSDYTVPYAGFMLIISTHIQPHMPLNSYDIMRRLYTLNLRLLKNESGKLD